MSIREIGHDKSSIPSTFQTQFQFEKVMEGNALDENWTREIGKSEKQTLPSGIVLLTGKAAMEKVKTMSEDVKKIVSSELINKGEITSIEAYLADSSSEKHDTGRYETKLLGTYGNIVLTAPKFENVTDKDLQKLFVDTVRSLEKGMEFPTGKKIMSSLETFYPTVIELVKGAELSQDTAEESNSTFNKINYDPNVALETDRGLVPPWVCLFHELAHIEFYNARRDKMLKKPSEPDWIRKGDYTEDPDYDRYQDVRDASWKIITRNKNSSINHQALLTERSRHSKGNGIEDVEDWATLQEKHLSAEANLKLPRGQKILVRRDYLDAGGTVSVDDPINFSGK